MKKIITLSLLASMAGAAVADDKPQNDGDWIGVFGQYYSADDNKPVNTGPLDDGFGLGAEAGFRFTDDWAARLELSYLDIDGKSGANDDSGLMYGADAMYFLEDDVMYLFGGLRQQHLDETYRMASLGLGKHWEVSDKLRVITEVATYYDFGQEFNDVSLKLGLSYYFDKPTSSAPTPAPAAPKDSDNDGVIDANDKCPATAAGVKVDSMGCAMDSDGDGVLDSSDQCPSTPRGTVVDAKGCKVVNDSDNDGVKDDKDQCPATPAGDKVYPENGCTVFGEEDVSISLEVLFANNSSEVAEPNHPDIVEFAEFMKRYGTANATIEGHTSAVGSASYNQRLSQQRADSVKTLLVDEFGISADRLEAVGYGESQLLNTANTAEAHRQNRRITATVSETIKVRQTK